MSEQSLEATKGEKQNKLDNKITNLPSIIIILIWDSKSQNLNKHNSPSYVIQMILQLTDIKEDVCLFLSRKIWRCLVIILTHVNPIFPLQTLLTVLFCDD